MSEIAVRYYDAGQGPRSGVACVKCGSEVERVECETCGGEGIDPFGHDCGEDCCNCLNPEPNLPCDICDGEGGWWHCPTCIPVTPRPRES